MDEQRIIDALGQWHLVCVDEYTMHDGLAQILTDLGIAFAAEKRLSARDRIDFYLPESQLGIECKISGSVTGVTRQLRRYAGHDRIAALLLVTNRRRLRGVPPVLNGKSVAVHIQESL